MKGVNPDYTLFCSQLKMFTRPLSERKEGLMDGIRYAMPRYPTGEEIRRKFGSGYLME